MAGLVKNMKRKENRRRTRVGVRILIAGIAVNSFLLFPNENNLQPDCTIIKAYEAVTSTEMVNGIEWSYEKDFDRIRNVHPVNKDILPEDVIIPDKLGGIPITVIGENAFSETKIKSITIPDTVNSVSSSAFADCPNLTTIKLPRNSISVGKNAFRNCKALTDVFVEWVEDSAFEGCTNLKTVTIPNAATSKYRTFGSCAFKDCTSLQEVTIDDSAVSLNVGAYAFEGCISLKKVNISETNLTLEKSAFSGCCQLSDFTFKGTVTSKVDAFKNCTSFTSMIFEKDATLANGSFRGCTSLKDITFNGNAVYSFSSSADSVFEGCSSLNKVTFNEQKADIVFDKNESIEEIIYNNTKIIYGRLNGMKNLKKVVFQTKNPDLSRFACSDNGNFTVEGYLEEGPYASFEGHNTVYQWAQANGIESLFTSLGTIHETADIPVTPTPVIPAPISQSYLVTFDGNGGFVNGVLSKSEREVMNGKTYGALNKAARKGYIFNGWYTQKTGGNQVTADTKVDLTKNITLYAQWSKVSVVQGKISKLVNTKPGRLTITIKKASDVDGYEILYSDSRDFADINQKTVSSSAASYAAKKLSKGQTCYVKVRAYKIDSTGEKVYGKYSTIKKMKIKK